MEVTEDKTMAAAAETTPNLPTSFEAYNVVLCITVLAFVCRIFVCDFIGVLSSKLTHKQNSQMGDNVRPCVSAPSVCFFKLDTLNRLLGLAAHVYTTATATATATAVAFAALRIQQLASFFFRNELVKSKKNTVFFFVNACSGVRTHAWKPHDGLNVAPWSTRACMHKMIVHKLHLNVKEKYRSAQANAS